MRLHSVRLQNYRRYVDLSIDCGASFNVIVGVNGSGKTSLLSGIAEALNGVVALSGAGFSLALSGSKVVRVAPVETSGRVRFEPFYPVTVWGSATVFGVDRRWSVGKVQSDANGTFDSGCHLAGDAFKAQINAFPDGMPLPIVAYFRADRRWAHSPVNSLSAAVKRDARMDAYASWLDASADTENLQLWLVSRYLERLQSSAEAGGSLDAIDDDELAAANGAIANVIDGAKGFRYDMKSHALLIEWIEGPPTPFENLSDGQRSAICLVADIVRRMCLLNPQLGKHVLRDTPGVVLIDELDMHLHPAWQRMLVLGLKSAFPSVQFIAASHSPQVLGELQPEEIIVLGAEGTSHPEVSYGMDSSRILEAIMDAPPRPEEVQDALDRIFELLDADDVAAAREHIDRLKGRAPGVADLSRAEALLRRKEIIGR